jgi:hypothetical protein
VINPGGCQAAPSPARPPTHSFRDWLARGRLRLLRTAAALHQPRFRICLAVMPVGVGARPVLELQKPDGALGLTLAGVAPITKSGVRNS